MKETIEALKNFWANNNSKGFMRCVYMHRTILESVNERYVDAVELINGCDNKDVRDTLMCNLLDFTEKYADGKIPKNIARETVLFSIQMIQDEDR